MIRTVIFDLDDTLFPEHEFVLSGFRAVDGWIRKYYHITEFFNTAKRLFAEGKRGRIFDSALAIAGVCPNPALIDTLLQVYRQHMPAISLYEDAKWALDYLKNKNTQLGIITDGYLATQQNKVKSLGIAGRFSAIVYSDKYGRENWKPSSVPYLKIMELLGSLGEECVYIGDNPAKDFISPKKLGWQSIHICRKNGQYAAACGEKLQQADRKIASLYELEQLI